MATAKTSGTNRTRHIKRSELGALVEEATIDAYGESEQALGLFTRLWASAWR